MLLELFIFIFLIYGITNIIVFGSIFDSFRNLLNNISPNILGKLFSCPMCMSTWVGFICSYLFDYYNVFTPFTYYGINNLYLKVFFDGCLSSGLIWLIHTIQEYYEYRTE